LYYFIAPDSRILFIFSFEVRLLKSVFSAILTVIIVVIASMWASQDGSKLLVDHSILPKQQYPIRKSMDNIMAKYRLDVVLLGNSMLIEGVEPQLFCQLTGASTTKFCLGGTASAWWYLVLKNVIAKAPHKPKVVVVFFRDHFLTDPSCRVSGKYMPDINEMVDGSEPLLDRLAYLGNMDRSSYWLLQNSSLMRQHDRICSEVAPFIKRKLVGPLVGRSVDEIENSLEKVFADKNLDQRLLTSRQLALESTKDDTKYNFSEQLGGSFLPHMIDIAEDAGIQLVFVRVKRRRDLEPNKEPQELTQYMKQLGSYLEKHNVPLLDFTNDDRLKLEHYAAGDHLNRGKGRELFTRMVAQRMMPILSKATK
jgi:hypothetical protein